MPNLRSYAIVDPKGRLIGGENVDTTQDSASTTKVWTLYTLAELSERGIISRNFITEHHSDITRMMRDSSNAATHRVVNAAAAQMGGPPSRVIQAMNELAGQQGLSRTHFVTPDGWPAHGHYSTARDMAQMMHLFQRDHPELLSYSARITTAPGIIGHNGVSAFKTGTATGYYGGSGRSAGVGAKNGYSFSLAGIDGVEQRRTLVESIARAIPDTKRKGPRITQAADAPLSFAEAMEALGDMPASLSSLNAEPADPGESLRAGATPPNHERPPAPRSKQHS